eukprot:TRINITY_DN16088_c0_g1_i1.p2 TRINITY_DN16088_c0_g1~~TRINITY_DN16088_c0_g1_i1.p2  ORF type:complete len:157 (-),score=8.42 TRINITY_DN16088_c0_g1_i1:1931-2401(-)
MELIHQSMSSLLQSLFDSGLSGSPFGDANGVLRQCHQIIASYCIYISEANDVLASYCAAIPVDQVSSMMADKLPSSTSSLLTNSFAQILTQALLPSTIFFPQTLSLSSHRFRPLHCPPSSHSPLRHWTPKMTLPLSDKLFLLSSVPHTSLEASFQP